MSLRKGPHSWHETGDAHPVPSIELTVPKLSYVLTWRRWRTAVDWRPGEINNSIFSVSFIFLFPDIIYVSCNELLSFLFSWCRLVYPTSKKTRMHRCGHIRLHFAWPGGSPVSSTDKQLRVSGSCLFCSHNLSCGVMRIMITVWVSFTLEWLHFANFSPISLVKTEINN